MARTEGTYRDILACKPVSDVRIDEQTTVRVTGAPGQKYLVYTGRNSTEYRFDHKPWQDLAHNSYMVLTFSNGTEQRAKLDLDDIQGNFTAEFPRMCYEYVARFLCTENDELAFIENWFG